jgi:polyhydroxyalkanoate synthesis regulator phasin
VKDAIKGYVALASGLTEVTRQRATSAAKALVAQGEATAGQVQALADDLVAQSKSNREALVSLVRYEVDKALGRVGLVGKDEVDALQRRVKHLEGQLRDAQRGSSGPARATKAPAKKAVKKAPAKKAPAKKAAAKKAAARKAPAKAGTRG